MPSANVSSCRKIKEPVWTPQMSNGTFSDVNELSEPTQFSQLTPPPQQVAPFPQFLAAQLSQLPPPAQLLEQTQFSQPARLT